MINDLLKIKEELKESNISNKILLNSILDEKIDAEIRAIDIANYFIKKANNEGLKIKNWHLQSLVFLSHAIKLGAYNKPIFNDEVYAWDFGPVMKELYDSLKKYSQGFVTETIGEALDDKVFSGENLRSLEKVWELFYLKYIEYYDYECVKKISDLLTVEGSPWHKTFVIGKNKYEEITPELIARGYSKWIKIK